MSINRGRLTLCCNLSGFRGAAEETDVVADLNVESVCVSVCETQGSGVRAVERKKDALAALRAAGVKPDLYAGSPCLFCLQSFGKIPWRGASEPELVSIRGRA
jgi:hypothetical protein